MFYLIESKKQGRQIFPFVPKSLKLNIISEQKNFFHSQEKTEWNGNENFVLFVLLRSFCKGEFLSQSGFQQVDPTGNNREYYYLPKACNCASILLKKFGTKNEQNFLLNERPEREQTESKKHENTRKN